MVSAGATLGGNVLKSTIVIGARLAALTRFKQLSAAILTSNNGILKFARGVAITSLAMAVLTRGLKILVNPVTGILALLQTGLSTVRWLQYERAVRQASFELRLYGLSVRQAEEATDRLTRLVGRAAATEFFQLAGAGRALADAGPDLTAALAPIAEFLAQVGKGSVGINLKTLLDAFNGAPGGFQTLESLLGLPPNTIQNINDVEKALADVKTQMDEGLDLTNFESMRDVLGDIRDRIDPLIGQFSNFTAAIPLLGAKLLKEIIDGALDVIGNFVSSIDIIIQETKLAFETIADVIIAAMALKFDEIPKLLKENLAKMATEAQAGNLAGVLTLVGGVIGFKFGGVIGAVAGVTLGTVLAKEIESFKDDANPLAIAFAITGAVIGFRFGGLIGGAAGSALGFTLGKKISELVDDEDFRKQLVTGGVAIGTLLGLIIGGPGGALIGAIVGGLAAATVLGILDSFKRSAEDLVGIGKFIGGKIKDGIIAALKTIPTGFGLFGSLASGGANLVGRAGGGFIPGPIGSPQLVVAHGGEFVSPVGSRGSSGGGNIPEFRLFIDGSEVDVFVERSVTRLMRQAGLSPRTLSQA